MVFLNGERRRILALYRVMGKPTYGNIARLIGVELRRRAWLLCESATWGIC